MDQLFNSSEKRLARALLLLAHFGKEGKPETVIAKISQEALAEMIGTTRSRVSFFMNRFRKLGFIDYRRVARAQLPLNVVLHDQGSATSILASALSDRHCFCQTIGNLQSLPWSGNANVKTVTVGMIGCIKARAMQTGRVLKENGLNSQNVTVEWYGAIRPIASNETAQGRQMNRRVEIVVYSVDSRDSSGPIAATTDK